MSTKETLPPDEDAKDLLKWKNNFPWFVGVALRIELRNKEIISLRNLLDAAEKETKDLQMELEAMQDTTNTFASQVKQVQGFLEQSKQANAELVKDRERLEGVERLANFDLVKNCKCFEWMPDKTLRQAIDAAITKGTV